MSMLCQSACRVSFSLLFLAMLIGVRPVKAEPVSWMERYALSNDREAMLAELIPGSDDYYFYHCLLLQTTGQLERSEAILREWLASHNGRETPAIIAMTDRQRLLGYELSPQRSIDYLVRRLGVQLKHAPPATRNERRFPSELDASVLSVDRLLKEALQRRDGIKPPGLRYLANRFLEEKTAGFSIKLRELLGRVEGAYIDNLGDLVIMEIKSRPPNEQAFGDLKAHQFLTLKELQKVAREVPKVAADNNFVSAMLQRLRPNGDQDAAQQLDVQTDYLIRIESYVRTLPRSYAGMQASAVHRLLKANLQNGIYDRDLFDRYLRLPRVSPIVHEDLLKGGGARANLNEDFMDRAMLPPVGNEEPVVRAHLEHFLEDEVKADAFAKYLKPDYLRRVFAETKLMRGVGSEEQWYKMLNATERQRIRDQVELRLSVDNPSYFDDANVTRLKVEIKNIPEIVIRMYEINTPSYYRNHQKPIDTDIDLDGLIASHERKLTFNQAAVIRHNEELALPEIMGRGVWVVDLVGKGLRARALIRRGRIDHVHSSSADGMVFTIIDENRQPIPTATMWVGSREFIADDEGRVTLPPVVDQVSRRAVISDGSIAAAVKFSHLQEQYRLSAGMHLDRSMLQSGGQTEVLIRPQLMLGTTPIAPRTMTDVSVQVAATDLDGIVMNHELEDLQFTQDRELVVPIRVPARLSKLTVTLNGSITKVADGQQQSLNVSRTWDVAGIRQTNFTHDSFLTRDGEDYIIEVRGRNGELVSSASLTVSLSTDFRNSTVDQTLQSDDQGRVRLGALKGVNSVRFSVASGLLHQRNLDRNAVRWADELHTTVDREIELPLAETVEDVVERYRLIEVRGGAYGTDRSDRMVGKNGLLRIRKLPAGDYHLIDRATAKIVNIAVIAGPVIDTVAIGETRHRQMSLRQPLGIASIREVPEGLRIQLSGQTQLARVHLYASRYVESNSPIGELELPIPSLLGRRVYLPKSGYVSDLRLGDEYQYVLRRRYAKKYPGVMLPQPGILLNPWETEETSNTSQSVRSGETPPASAQEMMDAAQFDQRAKLQGQTAAAGSDYDFLADYGIVLPNLIPDANGVVLVESDLIKDLPILQIVACDPAVIVQRMITVKAKPAETVDLRLAKSLDAAVPYTFKRGVLIAGPDQPLDLTSLGSAQLQVYGSVAQLMNLYKTLVADPRLNDFDELGVWHALDQDAKLDAYSRLASHELHLFLRFHDRGFFDQVVKPYLENKKEKQFIDHWLLDQDLTPYTRLWEYNQLNAAERTLLAMRVPAMRKTVQRQLQETVDRQDENYEALRIGIESALKANRLNATMDKNSLSRDREAQQRLGVSDGRLGDIESETIAGRRRTLRKEVEKAKAAAPSQSNAPAGLSNRQLYRGRVAGDQLGGGAAAFFRKLDATKQWAEGQWDHVRTVGGPSPTDLIKAGPFWNDLASMDVDELGVSDNLLRPIGSRHDALVALALCGLPLTAGNVNLPTEPEQAYQPEHAVAVVTKQLQELEFEDVPANILLGQRFEKMNSASGDQGKENTTEPIEFLAGAGYQGHIVVSNPNMAERTVEIFWQLPAGSLPLAKNRLTDSRTIKLKPFAVQAISYQFYFPAAGEFSHYPATVGVDGKLLARGEARQFNVVSEFSEDNEVTWENIAANGEPTAVKEFLAEANLRGLDWSLIAHRMKDPAFYEVVTAVLGDEKLSVPLLWAYGFAHRDEAAMQIYLSTRKDLCSRVGPVLDSSLLRVEPIERRMHELLEYSPLVRARIHRLGEQDEILNSTFRAQYEQFSRTLGFSSRIEDKQWLVMTYYLLIQNRITEAIDTFGLVDPAKINTRLQYDYLSAYLAMHEGNYDKAEQIAVQHAEDQIPRWRGRFSQLAAQLKQRKNLARTEQLVAVDAGIGREPIPEGSGDLAVMDRELQQASASEQQPEVVVRVEGNTLRIDHRRSKEAVVNFYGVDLELLFSKAPFVRDDLQRMAMVEPMRSDSLKFESATGVGRMELDENQQRQTLLIEVVAGAARSTALYYGGDITTYVSEGFGQLQTTDSESHRPIPSAYVKVYGKYSNGQIKFFKDGYTDSRGRFDYASISAADAQGASRFAILVISDEKGATVHDVAAPNQ